MQQYLDLMKDVMENGVERPDRTGTGTLSVFGRQMRFDLSKGFPLLTTKKVYWKGVVYELLWFIKGDTNIKYLHDHNVHIWDEWCAENGELNYIYPHQWRNFGADGMHGIVSMYNGDFVGGEVVHSYGVDQLKNVIESIKKHPSDRGHIVCAWNPIELPKMVLRPCHCLFQFYVASGKLSCQLYQRSCDVFLGLPFNIASYSLLTHMIAKICDLDVGEFVWTGGDTHLYLNHLEQARTQLERIPRSLPSLSVKKKANIEDYDFDDLILEGYDPHPVIKAPISV